MRINLPAFLNTVTTRGYTLPIVVLYVTAGCNLRCIMCSYRDPLPNELSIDEIRNLARQLSELGLRHIVYSGGEPLTRRDFPDICNVFKEIGVKQSLLTNGLLLQKRYDEIVQYFSEIIVSLDGPTAEIHNNIRGLDAFDQIVKGIQTILSIAPPPKISIRTVIQRKNFREIGDMVKLATALGVDRISFLAADVSSGAFHRAQDVAIDDPQAIMLTADEAREFRSIVKKFASQYHEEIKKRFVSESKEKLMHIAEYFEAIAGLGPFPRNHCNAPMVSTVITSTGDLLPCYFLPPFGNIRAGSPEQILNNSKIRETRRQVRQYSFQQCHECVCTLNYKPAAALLDRF